MRGRRGFTLIELLVVIAIIAILAAILLPVFARARENARKAQCMNNSKQLALAWMQYSQDYDELTMPYSLTGSTGARAFRWVTLIQPYLKSTGVLRCPSNPKALSYSYNYGVATMFVNGGTIGPTTTSTGSPRSLASIPLPAQTPVFTDANGITDPNQCLCFTADWYGCSGRKLADPSDPNSVWVGNTGYLPGIEGIVNAHLHLDGTVYCFVDGHSKWIHSRANPRASAGAAQANDIPSEGLDYNPDGLVGTAAEYD